MTEEAPSKIRSPWEWESEIVQAIADESMGEVNGNDFPVAAAIAIIEVESRGDPGVWDKRSRNGKPVMSNYIGLMQMGIAEWKETGGSTTPLNTWYTLADNPPEVPRSRKGARRVPIHYRLRNNGPLAIRHFMRRQKRYNATTEYIPEMIAVLWKGGPGTAKEFKRRVKAENMPAALAWLGSGEYTEFVKGSLEIAPENTLAYVEKFRRAYKKALGQDLTSTNPKLTDRFIEGQLITDAIISDARQSAQAIYGGRSRTFTLTPFEMPTYITPEELRKGIIPQVFFLEDWHLAILNDPENEESVQQKGSVPSKQEINNDLQGNKAKSQSPESAAGSFSLTKRARYAQSIIEAEFWNRRYASRSVPAVSGPFNPYPVAGFPGLVLTSGRPVLGYITNVTHNISVEGASGTTGISMDSPRYWDEGEVWYWVGGQGSERITAGTEVGSGGTGLSAYRRFPQWHNQWTVATNSWWGDPVVTKSTTNRKETALDIYYQFILGCNAIGYYSNNAQVATPEAIERTITERDPGDFDVNPETLEIREYNKHIAEIDESGRFAQGTLAHEFYGHVKPNQVTIPSSSVEEQMEFTERYGVREYELFVEFLQNYYYKPPGTTHTVLRGPTYGDSINSLQRQVLAYIEDLESGSLEGGY